MRRIVFVFFQIKFFLSLLNKKSFVRPLGFFLKKYILGKKIVGVAVIGLTYRCQCKCPHCSVGRNNLYQNILNREEWKKVIIELKNLGTLRLHFSGGEPLLNKDLLIELIEFAASKGLIVFLETNGLLLDLETAQRLKKAGTASIDISLDSSEEQSHDYLRGINGSFSKVIEAVKICRKIGIPHMISTYASKEKIYCGDLIKTIQLAVRLKVPALRILHPQPSGRWLDDFSIRLNHYDRKLLNKQIIENTHFFNGVAIVDRTNVVVSRCLIKEQFTIYIAPDGEVSPCPHLPFSFGNFHDSSLTDLLERMSKHSMFQSASTCCINDINFRKKNIEPVLSRNDTLPVRM